MSALSNGRRCLAAGVLGAVAWAGPHDVAAARQAVASRCEAEATWSLPMWFREWFDASAGLKSHYDIACYLNPFYHRANFDGRGQLDLVVLVVERTTGKRGVLIVHRPGLAHFILGAGTKFGNGWTCGRSTRRPAMIPANLKPASWPKFCISSSRNRQAVGSVSMGRDMSGCKVQTSWAA